MRRWYTLGVNFNMLHSNRKTICTILCKLGWCLERRGEAAWSSLILTRSLKDSSRANTNGHLSNSVKVSSRKAKLNTRINSCTHRRFNHRSAIWWPCSNSIQSELLIIQCTPQCWSKPRSRKRMSLISKFINKTSTSQARPRQRVWKLRKCRVNLQRRTKATTVSKTLETGDSPKSREQANLRNKRKA
jgi:hypothetical protein